MINQCFTCTLHLVSLDVCWKILPTVQPLAPVFKGKNAPKFYSGSVYKKKAMSTCLLFNPLALTLIN